MQSTEAPLRHSPNAAAVIGTDYPRVASDSRLDRCMLGDRRCESPGLQLAAETATAIRPGRRLFLYRLRYRPHVSLSWALPQAFAS